MSKAIRYSGDQLGVGRRLGLLLIQLVADCLDYFSVGALTMASDAIAPALLASACCKQKGIHMIFNVQPVAHVEAIAV